MDFFINLYNSNPVVAIVLGLIVIFAVVSIFKGLLKLALTLAIVAVVAVVFFDVNPDTILKKGEEVTQVVNEYYEKTLKPLVDKELGNAKYEEKEDGSFLVTTTSLTIEGKTGEDFVIVTHKGKSTKVDISLLGNKFKEFVELQK